MVRFYDPTRTDPTILIYHKIKNTFNKPALLQENEIKGALRVFLQQESYIKLMEKYKSAGKSFPEFEINKACSSKTSHLSVNPDFQYFKAYYAPIENRIVFCQNLLKDLLDLKENLDREVVISNEKQLNNRDISKDDVFAAVQIKACKKQYENLSLISDDLRREMTMNCAKYLMKNRGPNMNKLPFDSWVRFANRIVDKNAGSYYEDG